ncbi:MAG TPA: hypothetical protein VGO40_13370 [Longimicrobium sp.]|jgi:hypothetical protein|nr:hypothetical protein [Longimicrobium sp.]
MTIRFPALAGLAAVVALAACGGAGTGPTAAAPLPSVAGCAPAVTLDLQPGQTAPLTSGQAACFALSPHAGARYALAGFDARSMDAARTGPEPSMSGDAVFLVGDGTGTAAIAAPNLDRSLAAPAGLRYDAAPDVASPFVRATPWRVGERFPVRRVDTGESVTARVVRIMGGRYVFALVEADEEGHTARFVSDTEKGMDVMLRDGVDLLNRTWGAGEPSTSAGSGQVLVVYSAWNPDQGAGTASTYAAADGSGVGTYVWLNLNVRPGVRDGFAMLDVPSYRLKVLAHELTHAWQMRYAYASQAAGPRSVSFGPAWAVEGTADLVAMEVVRRSLGIGVGTNWGWQSRLKAPNDGVTYALQPADTRGRVSRGYYDAASFLQDVQLRMVRRGTSADEALAQVARGAVEGWYGVDGAGVRRTGLAERARAVLGAGWEPADAVLLWTLTQAADDQSDAPELNNTAYASVSDDGSDYAWKPAVGEVQAGRSFAYQVTRAAGSSFYVRVRDDGPGGTVSLSANVAATRWMIARIR